MIILEITMGVMLLTMIFGWFYVRGTEKDLENAEQGIRRLSAELEQVKAKQRVFEKRFMKLSEPADKIIITHAYDDQDAPKYGGF